MGNVADIVYEILLRLPVKTLKRFQCVCKSWSSLISSPQFQKDHFHRAQHSPLLFTLKSDEKLEIRFSTYNKNGATATLVNNFSKSVPIPYDGLLMQSCSGLVCLAQLWSSTCIPILICNPSTQELISLPPTEKPIRCVGFGYAASTQEFKLVTFFSKRDKSLCQVFTLSTDRWREVRALPYHVCQGTLTFLQEAIHFLPAILFDGVKVTDCIGAFDINTEEYRKGIRLPTCYYLGGSEDHSITTTCNFMRLTKLGGSLCLSFQFRKSIVGLELWLLKDYYNVEWVKGYSINLSSVHPYPCYTFWTYAADSMGDESIVLNCPHGRDKVLAYDPHERIVKVMKDLNSTVTYYVESFYPLRCK